MLQKLQSPFFIPEVDNNALKQGCKILLDSWSILFEYIVLKYYLLESDRSGGDNYDKACQGSTGQEKHDPPLLFDLNVDPGERFPISNNTEAYGSVKLL